MVHVGNGVYHACIYPGEGASVLSLFVQENPHLRITTAVFEPKHIEGGAVRTGFLTIITCPKNTGE
jgi:hypothetical protein